MTTIFYRNLKNDRIKISKKFRVGSWLHLENPDLEDIESLCLKFRLDKTIVKDILDEYEVPRIEKEENIVYLFTRFASSDIDALSVQTSPLLFVIGDDFFLTIALKSLSFLKKEKLQKLNIFTTQKSKLLILILKENDKNYFNLINQISKTIRRTSTNIESISNQEIMQFLAIESTLNKLLFGLDPDHTNLTSLLSGKYLKLFEEDKDLIEDVALNNGQLVKMCKSEINHVANIREAYSNIISNNLNKTMKLLTALTLILTIPTMIFSFFGMNVKLPFDGHHLASLVIILGTLILTLGLLAWFQKKDLL